MGALLNAVTDDDAIAGLIKPQLGLLRSVYEAHPTQRNMRSYVEAIFEVLGEEP